MDIAITTTPEQDAALEWLAGEDQTAEQYLTARIDEVLASYVEQYNISRAPITVDQGVQAFLKASPEQQAAAMQALGVEASATPPTTEEVPAP
jgi:hypothetical protein